MELPPFQGNSSADSPAASGPTRRATSPPLPESGSPERLRADNQGSLFWLSCGGIVCRPGRHVDVPRVGSEARAPLEALLEQRAGPPSCRALNAKLRSLNSQLRAGAVHWSLTCRALRTSPGEWGCHDSKNNAAAARWRGWAFTTCYCFTRIMS